MESPADEVTLRPDATTLQKKVSTLRGWRSCILFRYAGDTILALKQAKAKRAFLVCRKKV